MADKQTNRKVTLQGRVIIQGDVVAVTGLHIGGAAGALEIGGVDSPVIRNPLNNQPYIPGSSLRGKMRSLTERLHGSEQNFYVNRARGKEVLVHTCQGGNPPKALEEKEADKAALESWRAEYQGRFNMCPVCSVFGVTGDEPVSHPTSLVVRDVFLSDKSVTALEKAQTDFPYTEIKWEATIDRVTSAATPRQIERVPAGAVFEGFELAYSIYDAAGVRHFPVTLKALQLLEEDYLGGLGSRGGGKVVFLVKKIYARVGREYRTDSFDELNPQPEPPLPDINPQPEPPGVRLTDALVDQITNWVNKTFADVSD
jgi:CRISPR-associated protein Csm3